MVYVQLVRLTLPKQFAGSYMGEFVVARYNNWDAASKAVEERVVVGGHPPIVARILAQFEVELGVKMDVEYALRAEEHG